MTTAEPSPVRSFERHLHARNVSDKTRAGYLESVGQVETFLATRGRRVEAARRSDLEAFLAHLLATGRTATTPPPPATSTSASSTAGWRTRRRSTGTR